ncbi:hypothetical protein B296_00020317 [Ensete ventricosum]|uniref:Uncharacterized protein n=1 Tax=Ensete ventricosum TaxID=4639 RepID=A0A426XIQ6_ENSVE|nr:hypothetical protein B296_00020317 [Ensete ventricosum]
MKEGGKLRDMGKELQVEFSSSSRGRQEKLLDQRWYQFSVSEDRIRNKTKCGWYGGNSLYLVLSRRGIYSILHFEFGCFTFLLENKPNAQNISWSGGYFGTIQESGAILSPFPYLAAEDFVYSPYPAPSTEYE